MNMNFNSYEEKHLWKYGNHTNSMEGIKWTKFYMN